MCNAINLLELIPRVHEAAKANGWWDTPRNAGEALMLVVSELSEALEADRKGLRLANWSRYNFAIESLGVTFSPEHFREDIKDSAADELADAYIRLCDFAGGFDVAPTEWISKYVATLSRMRSGKSLPENFGAALLKISRNVGEVEEEGFAAPTLCACLMRIEQLAAREAIDLATHIDLKLAYNATRGVRHGGKAY